MIFKKTLSLLCLGIIFMNSNAQLQKKIEYFNLQDIRLLNSPFKYAEDLDKKYILELQADRLLAPFLRESGLIQKAESYTNWENTGLDGHIGGHYLSALSYLYASTGDEQVKKRLDYMITELKRCQDANGNGYIGGVPQGKAIWNEIKDGNIKAGGFSLNGKWVPLYNIHKTYAGLRDAYLLTGNSTAKDMLIKMTDWAVALVSNLSESQIQDMLKSEHGGLNETFADVSAITGEERYIQLARQFSHQTLLGPLLKREDKLTGMHANTQIPKVLGFKRIADVNGNIDWSEAARFFWDTVVEKRSVSLGGNSVGEHFHPADDFSRMIKSTEGPETCNTYNMLRLTRMLYQTEPENKYLDYYERALYNHILSTQHPQTGGLVYFTSMRPNHYRVYSQPQTSMWCCVGSGIENHAKYGEMIYAHTTNDLYINLFIPSVLNWKNKNTQIIQENNFPYEAYTRLTVNPKKKTEFTLHIRIPGWVEKEGLKVNINEKNFIIDKNDSELISINRRWKKGDRVSVEMPMSIHAEQMPDKSNYFSLLYGPVVLAAKTSSKDLEGLFSDDRRNGHVANGKQIPIKDAPVIVSDQDKITSLIKPIQGKPLHFNLTGLFIDNQYTSMELEPFFGVHDARYIIYWPQATKDNVTDIQKKIEAEEQEQVNLTAITVDKVICGEQQPESDHFIQEENSQTGVLEDIHWRETKAWFSYELQNKDRNVKYIYIKYLDDDINRNTEVFVNNIKITILPSVGIYGGNQQTAVFPIPPNELSKKTLTIKFSATANSITNKILEVRSLKAAPVKG